MRGEQSGEMLTSHSVITATNQTLVINFLVFFIDAPRDFWDIRSLEKTKKN